MSSGEPPAFAVICASRSLSTFERVQWVIMTPAASLEILPAIPTKKQRSSLFSTALFMACPVKSPTSTKFTSSSCGSRRIAAFSVRPPVERTKVLWPCAPMTFTACTTLAAHAAVEKGRTMPVVPRMEMPPTMPRRALVVFSILGTTGIVRPWDAYDDADAARFGVEDFLYGVGDHSPRHGVYGGSYYREPQPRVWEDADAITPMQPRTQ